MRMRGRAGVRVIPANAAGAVAIAVARRRGAGGSQAAPARNPVGSSSRSFRFHDEPRCATTGGEGVSARMLEADEEESEALLVEHSLAQRGVQVKLDRVSSAAPTVSVSSTTVWPSTLASQQHGVRRWITPPGCTGNCPAWRAIPSTTSKTPRSKVSRGVGTTWSVRSCPSS